MYVQRQVGIDEERNGENQLQGGGIPLIAWAWSAVNFLRAALNL